MNEDKSGDEVYKNKKISDILRLTNRSHTKLVTLTSFLIFPDMEYPVILNGTFT